jgi:hypothetical protein
MSESGAAENSFRDSRAMSLHNSKVMLAPAKELPVFYLPNQTNDAGPSYPSLKLNVSHVYQQDVADILEESLEERRRESMHERKTSSKIKKILSSPPKARESLNMNDHNPQ